MTQQDFVALEGSYRDPPADPPICPAPENEFINVTVYLRERAPEQLSRRVSELAEAPVADRQYLTRAEFAQQFGAQSADIEAVRQFAKDHHLNVVAVHPERRTMELSGTVAAISDAFGVELRLHRSPTGVYRAHSGSVHVPRELAPAVVGVLGLDTRPVARPPFYWYGAKPRIREPHLAGGATTCSAGRHHSVSLT
jgi:kumamolisin